MQLCNNKYLLHLYTYPSTYVCLHLCVTITIHAYTNQIKDTASGRSRFIESPMKRGAEYTDRKRCGGVNNTSIRVGKS